MGEFFQYDWDKDMKTFATNLLAYYCMPTLLKLKPSNIVNVRKQSVKAKEILIQRIESEISPFHSKNNILYEDEETLILFIYNSKQLYEILNSNENKRYLYSFGYRFNERLENITQNKEEKIIEATIVRLKQRYQEYRSKKIEFPHEIGIILGYPLPDVEGFVQNKGKNYLLCGYWKVYHNADHAKKTFEKYYRMRNKAMKVLEEGRNLSEIIQVNDCPER
jgi:hypothetical protein